jgi:hypothetical protein
MSFTPSGAILGQYFSPTGTVAGAFTNNNNNNLVSISSPGGFLLLSVGPTGTVTAPGITSHHIGSQVHSVILTTTQYNSLPANPTVAQICAAAFTNPANSDLLQILGPSGVVVYRWLFNGTTATS